MNRHDQADRIMSLRFFQTDAFTDHPFQGNPAAVCLPDHPLDAELMQSIAREMNLSETAFPEPADADGVRRLRWFTPGLEVDLCGHATLATAAVLFDQGEDSPLRFRTRSGLLTVELEWDGAMRMDFPVMPADAAPAPAGLLDALGCAGDASAYAGPIGQYWMVRLTDESQVIGLDPDYGALGRVDLKGRIGCAVTAPGSATDFVSRFFAPWAGIDEDPVTGSAHCMLTPYWAAETGKDEMSARQVSERGGDLRVEMHGDRVHLIGRAVTVAEGMLRIP